MARHNEEGSDSDSDRDHDEEEAIIVVGEHNKKKRSNPFGEAIIAGSSGQRKLKNQKLNSFFDHISPDQQSELTEYFCNAVYSSNCALSMFESEHWKKFFDLCRPTFKVPSRKQMSTTHLDMFYEKIKAEVKSQIDSETMVSIMSDGWSNIRNEGIINYMVHTSKGDLFYDFSLPKAQKHTGTYIASELSRIIEEIGESKITAVVTDNAANMRAAWTELKMRYPRLQCMGCTSHTLNLLMKDMESLKTLQDHVANCKQIVKFFKLKHVPNAVLQEKQCGNSKSLKMPVETRWGSTVACMESIQVNKQALRESIINIDVEIIAPAKIKSSILSDDVFWDRNEKFLKLLSPVVNLITFMENTNATLSDVRHKVYKLKDAFFAQMSESPFLIAEETSLMNNFEKRIEMICTDTHNAAYLLDPRYRGENLTHEELERAIALLVELSSEDDQVKVIGEITNYRTRQNVFDKPIIWVASEGVTSICKNSTHVTPATWWKNWLPNCSLKDVAVRLLSMPPSAASCERNWSAWGIVHSKLRNRLKTTRSGKLVYIKYNLKLLSGGGDKKRGNPEELALNFSSEDEIGDSEEHGDDGFSDEDNVPLSTLASLASH